MKTVAKRLDGWVAVSIGITVFYLAVVIWPLLNLLRHGVTDGEGGFTLSYFSRFFSSSSYYQPLLNSLVVSVCVTFLALLVAYPMSYLMTMFKIRGNTTAQVLILASMMSPPFIGAYSWILLLGNNGLIKRWFKGMGMELPSIYGFGGILLVLTLQLVPLIFTYLMGAWKTLDVSLLEAAESMGSTGMRRAVKVIAPLLLPTVLAGSLLVFVRAFADFGTPMLIGQGFRTAPVLIANAYLGEVGTDQGFAAAVGFIVILVAMVVFFAQKFWVQRKSFSMTAMRTIEPKQLTGVKNVLAHAYVYGFLLLALAPLVVVVASSFRKTVNGIFVKGWSLDNYTGRASSDITKYLWNTITIGLTALVLLVILAILVSYLVVRRPSWLNNALDTMTMIPYVVPGLIIGISLLLTFNSKPIVLTGTMTIMVIALMLRRLPYTIRSTSALLYQHHPSIEEAAQSLGASKIKTLIKVVVPMLAPGILSGAILSWVTIITELSTTLFLYGPKTTTMSLGIYVNVIRGQNGTAAALSSVLLVITMISLFVLMRMPGGSKNMRV